MVVVMGAARVAAATDVVARVVEVRAKGGDRGRTG